MKPARHHAIVVVAAALWGGCQGDPLDDAEQIGGWANAASALGVFTHGYEPLAFSDGELDFADPSCPATSDDGTTVAIAGDGCEDSEGDVFYGSAIIVRGDDGRTVDFAGYGRSRDGGAAARLTGSFDVTVLGPELHAFDVDLVSKGGLDTRIEYRGTVAGSYQGPTLWNGEGVVHRDGITIDSGRVTAITVDQLRDDDICPGEGVSGTTTLVSEEHTVVITYDGAEDCDDDDSARWSRDGEDQGLVAGIVCALASPGRRGGSPPLAPLAPLVLLALALRRRA